jgi:hypothetical protein
MYLFGVNISIPQVIRLKALARRWIARARASMLKKEKAVKGLGFRGKRNMDMFEVHACSMTYVSVAQVNRDVAL